MSEPDYESLKSVWSLAAYETPVSYSASLPREYAAVYRSSTHEILINRPEYHGHDRPVRSEQWRMRSETTIIAHEIGHSQNRVYETVRFQEYMGALKSWAEANLDGTRITEVERLRILDEELAAMRRGAVILETFAPHLVGDFLLQESNNLKNYRSVLWTGAWPNGRKGVQWPEQPKWPPL